MQTWKVVSEEQDVTLDEIYEEIKERYSLDDVVIQRLMALEKELEEFLVFPGQEVRLKNCLSWQKI